MKRERAMNEFSNDVIETQWGASLHPAHCKNCRAAFLVPANAGAPLCANCLAARLEPLPALAYNAPPEMLVPFSVADVTLNANLERWRREIPFKPASLDLNALRARLTRVFVPMYLGDASMWGAWNAQMGFDYLVASSEERYSEGKWVTQRFNETRVRWEPRAGEISRAYENVPAPALENHARVMAALGDANSLPFDLTRAIPFATDAIQNALARAPEISSDAAKKFAELEMERRAARDCQTASNAQHHEQFILRAAFGEPHWTLLLLPMYVSSYADDKGEWIPVRVNGQTGFVSGVKRASMRTARRWTFLLGGIAAFAFLLTVFLALTALLAPPLVAVAGILLAITLLFVLAAPAPMIIAWQFNQQQQTE